MCRLNTNSFLKFSSLFYAWMICETTQKLSLKMNSSGHKWAKKKMNWKDFNRVQENLSPWKQKNKELMNHPRIPNTVHAADWSRLITGIKLQNQVSLNTRHGDAAMQQNEAWRGQWHHFFLQSSHGKGENEIWMLTKTQKRSIVCFTDSWLQGPIPDSDLSLKLTEQERRRVLCWL